MQGASNKQLEHATMVLLQTVEDLSACHYKGTTMLLPLFTQSLLCLDDAISSSEEQVLL